MSKIQDALRMMQDARRRVQSEETPASGETQKLATITSDVANGAVAGEQSSVVAGRSGPAIQAKHFAKVDRGALRTAGLLAPEQEERVLADEYRQIKRPLIGNAFGKRAARVESGRLILVASALPGDGKTFTCINLALSLAREKDRSVVLVDADVAKPHISDLFNLQDNEGLLDLIENPSLNMHDVIVQTDIERLALLPSGRTRAHATELLASERMEDVIQSLVDEDPNRLVLFDSPPLLITSESQVLAGLMGQIVVVVKAGVTPIQAISQAVDTLDSSKAINLVLNQVRGKDHTSYWGGHYGYGSAYGRQAQDGQTGDAENDDK